MLLKIHKGTDEIGGTCVELSTHNNTILFDYGTPLQKGSKQIRIEKKVDGIVISHPHQDHFGEIDKMDSSIPVYCGELSREMMNATRVFTGRKMLENKFEIFKAWEVFSIGDFLITPYLVDHSSTDAYAFFIEADGQKVLYSGDFRSNGRKSKLYYQMLQNEQIKGVDILLLEGTMLKRDNEDFPDEQSVENHIQKVISNNEKLSFFICSSQNIDSIVSAYRACKKARKIFVIDIYTAWILEKVRIVSDSVPNMAWEDVRVITKFGGNYYEKLKENPKYFGDFKSGVFNYTVDIRDLELNPSRYFIKVSPWHIQKIMKLMGRSDANIIYSQWLGYLTEEFSDIKTVELFRSLQDKYDWSYAHTSGHADLTSLKHFADSVNPKKIIPIHTEFKEEFDDYFANVRVMSDGETYDLDSVN